MKKLKSAVMLLLFVAGCMMMGGCATEAYYPAGTPVIIEPAYVYPYPYYGPYHHHHHHGHHW